MQSREKPVVSYKSTLKIAQQYGGSKSIMYIFFLMLNNGHIHSHVSLRSFETNLNGLHM